MGDGPDYESMYEDTIERYAAEGRDPSWAIQDAYDEMIADAESHEAWLDSDDYNNNDSNRNHTKSNEWKSTCFINTKIVGVTHINSDGTKRQDLIRNCHNGEKLDLVRDNNNKHDNNAIKVLRKNGEMLGYISKEITLRLAPIIDENAKCYAVVTKITGGTDDYNYGCNIGIHSLSSTVQQVSVNGDYTCNNKSPTTYKANPNIPLTEIIGGKIDDLFGKFNGWVEKSLEKDYAETRHKFTSIKKTDKHIIDTANNLIWTRDANIAISYASQSTAYRALLNGDPSKIYECIKYLNKTSYGSCNYWRIPTPYEIRNLYFYSRAFNKELDVILSVSNATKKYWCYSDDSLMIYNVDILECESYQSYFAQKDQVSLWPVITLPRQTNRKLKADELIKATNEEYNNIALGRRVILSAITVVILILLFIISLSVMTDDSGVDYKYKLSVKYFPQKKFMELSQNGYHAFDSHRYGEAIVNLKKAYDIYPTNNEINSKLALSYLHVEDYNNADIHFKRALPDFHMYLSAAEICLHNNAYRNGIVYAKAAIDINQYSVEPYDLIGRLYTCLHDHTAAHKYFEMAKAKMR